MCLNQSSWASPNPQLLSSRRETRTARHTQLTARRSVNSRHAPESFPVNSRHLLFLPFLLPHLSLSLSLSLAFSPHHCIQHTTMAPSRRNSNGRSPLVNQQRQITSFFTKTPTPSPSPSPILSKSNQKQNPNPIPDPNPNPTLTTPSPLNPKSHKPLLVIGASSTPSKSPSSFGEEVVGKRIKVYWPLDDAWYEGTVKSFDNLTSKHLVRYDDDEEECVDLSKEKIEWPKDSFTKKLKRLRRASSPLRKMVIDEDNEVEESIKEEEEHDSDDSEDEDWGKNAVLEDAGDDDEDKDIELEDEDDVAERVKGNPSGKVESKKRKVGVLQKQEPTKKIKSGTEVNKGAFKLSVLEPMKNLEGK